MHSDLLEEGGLPPGNYTRETLPPRSPEIAEFLEDMKRKAERLKALRPNLPPIQIKDISPTLIIPISGAKSSEDL